MQIAFSPQGLSRHSLTSKKNNVLVRKNGDPLTKLLEFVICTTQIKKLRICEMKNIGFLKLLISF